MKLSTHHRIGTFIFWFAQIVGGVTILALILFFGSTLISELLDKLITIKEDYSLFLLLFGEVLIAVAFKISWRKKRLGAVLVILLTILLSISWGGLKDLNFVYIHLPILFSGLLLLFYSYYKEWILKQKP